MEYHQIDMEKARFYCSVMVWEVFYVVACAKGRNAGKSWADFEKWQKEHPDGMTLESIILREEEQERARVRRFEEEESWHIADLRKELIRLISVRIGQKKKRGRQLV
jgi:predicted nucleic acid-binding protein